METLDRLVKLFQAVLEENVDISGLTAESNLREDLGINSIGLLYMAMAVEEEFGIKFKNEDFVSISTVADVIACIESKR
jgi:acyl carrier protein